MPPNEDIKELLRVTRDNNKLLHKMRRNSFWGGIIKFVIYILLFVVGPLYLYATYLAPVVNQMTKTYSEIQGTGARANAQMSDFQEMLKKLQSPFSSGE
jgi:hypothetical protein